MLLSHLHQHRIGAGLRDRVVTAALADELPFTSSGTRSSTSLGTSESYTRASQRLSNRSALTVSNQGRLDRRPPGKRCRVVALWSRKSSEEIEQDLTGQRMLKQRRHSTSLSQGFGDSVGGEGKGHGHRIGMTGTVLSPAVEGNQQRIQARPKSSKETIRHPGPQG